MANEWEKTFGTRVKELRQLHGWTQEELAQKMTDAGHPLHQTTVTKLENGSRPTSVGEVGALATLFGVPIVYMFAEATDDATVMKIKTLETRLRTLQSELARVEEDVQALMRRRTETQQSLLDTAEELKRMAVDYPQALEDLRIEVTDKVMVLLDPGQAVAVGEGKKRGAKT